MATETEDRLNEDLRKDLPIKHVVPEELPLMFSDQTVVKFQRDVFVLMFFQNRPPITLTREALEEVEHVESRCIAQVVLTPQAMEKNIEAMSANFEKFKKSIAEQAESKEEDQTK
ncbi:MAG: hypothetical protein IPM63_07810 [Acidobacteriota bacterium]|nr:MAG: hypothetical protein IPM63_07810 [Acidobacteriota bacterium]